MSGIPIRVNPTHCEEVDDSDPEVQVVNLQVNADSNETIRNVSLNGVVSTICNNFDYNQCFVLAIIKVQWGPITM